MVPLWDNNLDTFSARAVFSQCAGASEHHKVVHTGRLQAMYVQRNNGAFVQSLL